ncbi:MAG: hybrid sensor histidine kinase/response regulator [Polyangiaceae bacterium]|nr:hybrid sensor histidine kinase/response regulator [Polyangiaceae bacterium]
MSTYSPVLLIVDDDPLARQIAQAFLSADKYRFRQATGGEAAIKQFEQEEPDLVLLDIMMPGIDGFEVCRRIRQRKTRAYVPIILVTALDGEKGLARGVGAGADDFISKPVERFELRARVRSLLRIRRQHMELEQQARQITEFSNQREDLVRMVVHDLRSPVTVIQLAASALLSNAAMARADKDGDLSLIKEEARRVGNYLEEMLLLARQEEGRLSLSFAQVDLYSIAQDTIHALKPAAKARGLHIRLAPSENPPIITGDAALLRRLVDNMLTNAIKFSPSNTEVTVTLGRDGANVTLDVDDEGPGVPEEMRKRIFEKFEIVKLRAAGGPQTGLGLPFCRTVVEAHGGYISCLPREGRGSRFHVTFPTPPRTDP